MTRIKYPLPTLLALFYFILSATLPIFGTIKQIVHDQCELVLRGVISSNEQEYQHVAQLNTARRTFNSPSMCNANSPSSTPVRWCISPPTNTMSVLELEVNRFATGSELVTTCNGRPTSNLANS